MRLGLSLALLSALTLTPLVASADPLPVAPDDASMTVAQAEPAYGVDRYPGVAFILLTPEERVTFVELAEAELCPCPGQISSLDTCLQSEETTCSLANNVGSLMMRQIKEGADNAEIADAIQRHVQAAREVHEFDLSATPVMGGAEAPVSVVVFSDFQCPHCRQFAPLIEAITESYGGQVSLYAKQFPLNSHPASFALAVAALAAHQQGQFWPFQARLFEDGAALAEVEDPAALLTVWATELGMDAAQFEQDVTSTELAGRVSADRQEGLNAGIDGTPTVFINGVRYLDDYSEEALRATIDSLLANPE